MWKWIRKNEETDQKKRGNHSTINIGKRIQNIRKSLNNSELLREFLEIPQKSIWSVSVLLGFHVTNNFCILKVFQTFSQLSLLISFSFSDRSGLVHLMLRFHSSPSWHRTWTSQSICHKCWWENSGEPRECS